MAHHDLYRQWIDELWSGRTGASRRIVGDGFVGHWPDRTVRGVEDLVAVIDQTHAMLDELEFTVEVAPFGEGDMVAGRWRGRGRSADGPVEFVGNDILRIGDGRVVEYWVATATLP